MGSLTVDEYLSKLHSKVIYADCAGEEAYIPSLHHNRLVNMDEFLLPILTGMFKKGEPITTDDPITGEMFTEHITAQMGHKEIVEKFKFFDKVVEENSQKEFKTFTKFFGRKTPSEGFREAVELRNKLLNQGLPEELLTPSVDILEEISVHNHDLHIIHGDPGYGKTIHLQQISERFVRQQRTSEQATMPVCIKAKHLAASIREHAKEEREINRDPEDITANDMTWKILTYGTTSTLHTIIAKAIQLTNFPKDVNMNDDLASLLKENSSRIVFFIDAFDEAREMDMPNLVHFISRITNEASNSVILTNRNSHADQFGRLWKKMPDRESKNHGIRKYHIDFTPDELRHDMPGKLMAAWEIDGMDIEMRMERGYRKYERVLTHPLFVGFFALMIKENQIQISEDDELTNLSTIIGEPYGIKGYTVNHVTFLNNVIDLGIKKALEDRNYAVTPERMKEIFISISYAINIFEQSTALDELLADLEASGILEVTKAEIEAIKNGVGPLYTTDGTSLEWTHKGMSEIGCSQYILTRPELFLDKMGSELFYLDQLLSHANSNPEHGLEYMFFDWLVENNGNAMFEVLSMTDRRFVEEVLAANSHHENCLDLVFDSGVEIYNFLAMNLDLVEPWFKHKKNNARGISRTIFSSFHYESLGIDEEWFYGHPKVFSKILDCWQNKFQTEIRGAEDTLRSFAWEFFDATSEWDFSRQFVNAPPESVKNNLSRLDPSELSALGHAMVSLVSHSKGVYTLLQKPAYRHLRLLGGEPYLSY